MPRPLPVRHIRQFDDHSCGAAVAQMILSFRGVRPPENGMSDETWQRAVWADIERLTTGPARPAAAKDCPSYIESFVRQQCVECRDCFNCWAATPQALDAVINSSIAQPSHSVGVRRAEAGAQSEAMAAILNSIDRRAPVGALVQAGDHWLIVRGYLAGRPLPSPIEVGDRQLNAVYIRDPFELEATRCLIPAEEWMFEVFSPVDCGLPSDHERFVAVVDRVALQEEAMPRHPVRRVLEPRSPIGVDEAAAAAERHVEALLEADADEWQDPLRGARAGTPILVRRLDRPPQTYYVVPLERGGQITARLALDGSTGRLKRISALEPGGLPLHPWLLPRGFLEANAGRVFDVAGQSVRLDPAGTHVLDGLVWMPCKESRSPLVPFSIMITSGVRTYLRVDGELFPRLTRSGPGR